MSDIIRLRRSIRKFSDKTVDQSLVRLLLEAAMSAPSAGNQQLWEFLVVADRATILKLSLTGPNSKPAAGAPLVIMIAANKERERYKDYWPIDCSAATQNLLLEAVSHGLGAVWLGVHPVEERKEYLRNLFHLPLYIEPFALVCVGYPESDSTAARLSRFDAAKVHYESW